MTQLIKAIVLFTVGSIAVRLEQDTKPNSGIPIDDLSSFSCEWNGKHGEADPGLETAQKTKPQSLAQINDDDLSGNGCPLCHAGGSTSGGMPDPGLALAQIKAGLKVSESADSTKNE